MSSKPIFAIMYDFDRTLCPKDMQEYQFIPSLGMKAEEFWSLANSYAYEHKMDKINAYMYMMIKKSQELGIKLTRDRIVQCGENIELFPGVAQWFDRINAFGLEHGVCVEHYVLSSGLKEIIEGSAIGGCFKQIYASEFLYDESGLPVFSKSAVNYTSKTQFVYRINKGVFDVSNDYDLNRSTLESDRRVPFSRMLYIGDGLSDVPCMKMVKAYGGHSIAVYKDANGKKLVDDLLYHDRVDFIYPTDYRESTGIDITVKNMIAAAAVEHRLSSEHTRQCALINKII